MNDGSCPNCGAASASGALGGACPRCLARAVLSEDDGPGEESLPRRFGDYELLERIAHGGMGVVYRARQVSLGRIVAVKMLLAGEFATREFVQRFRGEAAAAAILHHPNIVAIHEVGVREGLHFFSMDFVEGRSLADLVGHTPLPARRAAQYTRTIAEAIHCAHERGILHRDLKPSNVLIDAKDQPRVTDFGLAKRLVGARSTASYSNLENVTDAVKRVPTHDLTLPGQVLGSPGFMPPEQAGAIGIKIGRHSDVYSLGAVLYHMLTARPPFQGETLHQVLQQAVEADPVSPRRLNPAVPPDLETICLKCLSKEPARRYVTAHEVADELGHFLVGEPIRARPVGLVGRAARWCRRKPAQAGLTAALIFALLAGFAGVLRELRRAERAERATTEQLGRAYLEQARANRRSGRSGQRWETLEVLRKAAALSTSPRAHELRDEAVAALALPDIRWLRQGVLRPGYVAFDVALERYAWSDPEGILHLCRVSDDAELFTLPAIGTNVANWHCFSADSRFLAVPYGDGRIRVWNLERRRVLTELTGGRRDVILEFSPLSDRLAATGPGNVVRVFDLHTSRLEREIPLPFRPSRMDYSSDGRHLSVLASRGTSVRLIEVVNGSARDLPHSTSVSGVAWHPSGESLATSTTDFRIHFWDVSALEARRIQTDHQSIITDVAFHPNGELLASSSWDGTTQLWDVSTGRRLAVLPRSMELPRFSRDGRWLGGLSDGFRRVELFAVEARRACRFLPEPMLAANTGLSAWSLDWSRDERLLAAAAAEGVRLWDVNHGHLLGLLPHSGARDVLFHPAGQELFSAGGDSLRSWPLSHDAGAGEWVVGSRKTISRNGPFGEVAISLDGETFAYTHTSWISVWTNGQRAFHLPHEFVQRVAVSPDGKWVGTSEDRASEIKLWEAATGRLVWRRQPPLARRAHLAFTPDSQSLVTGAANEFTFWNVATGEAERRFPRRDTGDFYGPIAFSRDGRLMALALTRTLVQLRDLVTGEGLAELDGPHPQMISSLCFSPSGAKLAALGEAHTLQVWDLRALRRDLSELGLDWEQPPYPPVPTIANASAPLRLRIEKPPLVIPPRPADALAGLVDLGAFYTGSVTQMWPDIPDNNLAQLGAGIHSLNGVSFDVRGIIALRHPELPQLPKAVRDIPVRQGCARLHFLHGVAFVTPESTKVGTYVVHYADGGQIEVPILLGYETGQWWLRPAQTSGRAQIAWSGTNPAAARYGHSCHLFQFAWENPRPGVEIVSLDFVSMSDDCSPFLVALTAE